MRIVVSPEAAADIVRLRTFLATAGPEISDRAIAAISKAVQSSITALDRGRPTPIDRVRDVIVPFGRSAYIVRYAHLSKAEEIIILRVWHGREDRD